MSFREKIHWAALVALVAGFGWYFLHYPWNAASTGEGLAVSGALLLPTTIVIICLISLSAAFLAIRTPREAHLKEDERDRTIHWRGTHIAYYPLVLGVWANLVAQFYRPGPALALNLLLATVVIAEIVRVGAQIWLYRRGH
jgi:hypothetical protein